MWASQFFCRECAISSGTKRAYLLLVADYGPCRILVYRSLLEDFIFLKVRAQYCAVHQYTNSNTTQLHLIHRKKFTFVGICFNVTLCCVNPCFAVNIKGLLKNSPNIAFNLDNTYVTSWRLVLQTVAKPSTSR